MADACSDYIIILQLYPCFSLYVLTVVIHLGAVTVPNSVQTSQNGSSVKNKVQFEEISSEFSEFAALPFLQW